MKLKIDIDVTPAEARAFFGMPDMEPLNQMIVKEMMDRAKDQMDTLADPERFVSRWIEMGAKNYDAFTNMMGAATGMKK